MKTRTSVAILTAATALSANAASAAVGGGGPEWQTVAMYAVIVACAFALFCFLCKVIRLLMVVAIMAVIAAAIVFYCVSAGYVDEKTVERLNPMNNESFADSMRRTGEWLGNKTRATVEKAVSTAVEKAAARDDWPAPPEKTPEIP